MVTDRTNAKADLARQPVRLLLHLACTGGTLIARAVQAQRGVCLLSEVDPYSDLQVNRKKTRFAPSDIINLARDPIPELDNATIGRMFMASLAELHAYLCERGRPLVLRVHSHSQFFTDVEPDSRPSVPSLVGGGFPILQAVTIRHPLDTFLALRHNKWFHFAPFTLHEYCNRTLAFMESVEGVPRLKYETFVSDPDTSMQWLCETLKLECDQHWRSAIPDIKLSGNSGRTGDAIEMRQRRQVPREIALEVRESSSYLELCRRLDYDPADAMPLGSSRTAGSVPHPDDCG